MSCTGCECCAQAATMRVEIAQLTESGVAMVDRWDEECKAHARTRHERDALREEVARLNLLLTKETERATKAEGENFMVNYRYAKAVAALRDAVKHCRQCNGIGEYWPHCDACADSTCDHECPPQRLCGVCAEWRAILADAQSTAAGEAPHHAFRTIRSNAANAIDALVLIEARESVFERVGDSEHCAMCHAHVSRHYGGQEYRCRERTDEQVAIVDAEKARRAGGKVGAK